MSSISTGDPAATTEVDVDGTDTATMTGTSPNLTSTLKTTPKPRTASASSGGGPSRVRAAATMWENKTSTSPVSSKQAPLGSPAKPRNTSGRVTPGASGSSSSGKVNPSSVRAATRSNSTSKGSSRATTSPSSTKRTPLLPKLSSPNGHSADGFAPSSFKSNSTERQSPSTSSPRSATPPPSLPSPVPPVPPLPVGTHSPRKDEELSGRLPSPAPVHSPSTSPMSQVTALLPAAPISPAAPESSPGTVPDPLPVISPNGATSDALPIVDDKVEVNIPERMQIEGDDTFHDAAEDDFHDAVEPAVDVKRAEKVEEKSNEKVEVEASEKVDMKPSAKAETPTRKAVPKVDIPPSNVAQKVQSPLKKASIELNDKPLEDVELRDEDARTLSDDVRSKSTTPSVPAPGEVAPEVPSPPKESLAASMMSYIPLSRETSPAAASRGVASLFSRVLPPSPGTSLFPPTAGVLPTTPPRGSSTKALKDDASHEPKAVTDQQWALAGSAKGNGTDSLGSSNNLDASPAPTPTSKSRFFSSATSAFSNLQLPSVNLPSLPSTTALQTRAADVSPPNEPATNLAPMQSPPNLAASPGSSWRTTMTSFLQRTQPSTPPPVPTTPSRNGSASAPTLKHVESVSDHGHNMHESEQEPLGEGFERVRNEMEVAAREIRRERAGRGISLGTDENVDWTFWGAVVQDYEEVANSKPKELSRAIQQGIPSVIRGPIWQLMSSSKSANLEETYKDLLKQTSPYEKAIQKDINRTFPSHKFFQGAVGQEGLFVVCKAYSLYDLDVGYTQGLAFIVATLLLNMPDEEAFCVLVRLMTSYNLRSHYLDDMPGLQLRLFQFDRLVEDVLPLLHTHLVRKGVKSSMYASQWLMTLFSYRFPLSLVYRVVDIVLAEGTEAVFRFAIALLRKCEDQLLQLEFEELLAFLTGDLYDCYRVDTDDVEEQWRTNDFVRDAYEIRITPLMLDQYEAEWNEKCRLQTAHIRQLEAHARETEQLRGANRHLSSQIKTLEASLATMNTEHVELVRQLVLAKIAKEDMETELVKYKAMCAALAQGREADVDLPHIASRGSANSLTALPPSRRGSGVPSPLGHSPNLSPNVTGAGRVSPGPPGRAEHE